MLALRSLGSSWSRATLKGRPAIDQDGEREVRKGVPSPSAAGPGLPRRNPSAHAAQHNPVRSPATSGLTEATPVSIASHLG